MIGQQFKRVSGNEIKMQFNTAPQLAKPMAEGEVADILDMGHKTPTNALACTGEQTKETNSARAIARFFTHHFR
jgi:poly(3-hydroxybutyrate) depolymerase